MSEKIKNYLGIAVILAVLMLAASAVSYVSTYSKSVEPSAFRSFAVTAEGKAVAVPDVAQFTFSVITEGGKDLGDLQKQNTQKTNKIIEYLKGNGVEPKDIKTVGYSVEPRYQYFSCPPPIFGGLSEGEERKPCPLPEISGYTVRQTVSVKVRNFDKTGELLAASVKEGANSVSQLNFTVDDPSEVQDQARAEAIAKAKAKAVSVAQAGGFRIGRLLSIDEGGFYPPPYYADGFGGGEKAAPGALASPIIEPGSQEVTINITLRYEIQ